MAAVSSESVDTITASHTPLSRAGTIVYASIGWPCSARTFLPGTRFEPWRAGMRATADGIKSAGPPPHSSRTAAGPALHVTGIMVDVNRLQIGVDVERLRARLAPSIARLTQPSKWHVRLAAVSAAVDHGDAGLDASDKGHGTVDVLRVDRGSETEWRVVRQRDRLVKNLHA